MTLMSSIRIYSDQAYLTLGSLAYAYPPASFDQAECPLSYLFFTNRTNLYIISLYDKIKEDKE